MICSSFVIGSILELMMKRHYLQNLSILQYIARVEQLSLCSHIPCNFFTPVPLYHTHGHSSAHSAYTVGYLVGRLQITNKKIAW